MKIRDKIKETRMNLAKQNQNIERLRDELDRLNKQWAQVKEAMGLNDDADLKVEDSQMTPAMMALMQDARNEAERASRQAVALLNAETAEVSAAPKRARRGALSI